MAEADNSVPIDGSRSPEQAVTKPVNYVSAEEEIPYLLEEIVRLTRENAQLRVVVKKLIQERNSGG